MNEIQFNAIIQSLTNQITQKSIELAGKEGENALLVARIKELESQPQEAEDEAEVG